MITTDLVIETKLLTKRFGDIVAVDGLSLEIPRGHVFGLLGPNGSGKTTTMGMLLGLVRPSAGRFSLFGGRITHREALTRTGAVVEFPSFYPYLSGRDNLGDLQLHERLPVDFPAHPGLHHCVWQHLALAIPSQGSAPFHRRLISLRKRFNIPGVVDRVPC